MTALATMKKLTPSRLESLMQAFPDVDPGEIPQGSLLLIQVRRAANKTAGGIVFTDNDMKTEFDNTNVAKVIALGPLSFRNRETGKPWVEGQWVHPGDYIRMSPHNVKSWSVALPGTRGVAVDERVTFGLLDDLHVLSIVKDPLATKAFF